MAGKRRRISVSGLLKLLDDLGGELFHSTKTEAFRKIYEPTQLKTWDEYFPSVIEKATEKLLRKGFAEKTETKEGITIKITEDGKKKLLMFNLEKLTPKKGNWDMLWRIVFFDIEEIHRRKRDLLRIYMKQLGLKEMQKSVWIGPYDIEDEIKYLREVLSVPNSVKLGILKSVENSEDLKEWFNLK
jgi:DNA-binding transcriptional regulator PaaX